MTIMAGGRMIIHCVVLVGLQVVLSSAQIQYFGTSKAPEEYRTGEETEGTTDPSVTELPSACEPNPCSNGGRCIRAESTVLRFKCRCFPPWMGQRCKVGSCRAYASGDPHYRTFDYATIHFMGSGKYVLVQSTAGSGLPPFKVLGQNMRFYPTASVSYIKYIEIHLFGHTIKFDQGCSLTVDGWPQSPPKIYQEFKIFRNGFNIRLVSKSDASGLSLVVEFDCSHLVIVTVSDNYSGKLEGMFGNCDKDENNDFTTKDGTYVIDHPNRYNLIGDSWAVTSRRRKRDVNPAPFDPFSGCRTETLDLIDTPQYCGYLTDFFGPFNACMDSELISNNPYFNDCKYDVCATQDKTAEAKEAACTQLRAFALACIDIGQPPTDWRTGSGCVPDCPTGMTYKADTSACPASCGDLNAEAECNLPNTEACVCPNGQVLLDQKTCVDSGACGSPEESKMRACIAVTVDISESIEDSSTKEQEADVLNEVWELLVDPDRLAAFHEDIYLMPFNEIVIEQDVAVFKTSEYTTKENFIAQEKENMEEIQDDIRTKDTYGLTDIAAVLSHVARQTECDGDVKVLIMISDFIAMLNKDKVEEGLQELTNAGVKVIAVGLNKERMEDVFDKVKAASGLYVDLALDDLTSDSLKIAVNSAFSNDAT